MKVPLGLLSIAVSKKSGQLRSRNLCPGGGLQNHLSRNGRDEQHGGRGDDGSLHGSDWRCYDPTSDELNARQRDATEE